MCWTSSRFHTSLVQRAQFNTWRGRTSASVLLELGVAPAFLLAAMGLGTNAVAQSRPVKTETPAPRSEVMQFADRKLRSIESVKRAEDKCDALLDWLERFSTEYPNASDNWDTQRRMVYLYRDEDFTEVFGKRFDQTAPKWRVDFYNDVFRRCFGYAIPSKSPLSALPRIGGLGVSAGHQRALSTYAQRFSVFRAAIDGPFLGQTGLFSPDAVVKAITQAREARARMNGAIAAAIAAPATIESFRSLGDQMARVPRRIPPPSSVQSTRDAAMRAAAIGLAQTSPLAALWPSETEHLRTALETRRREIVVVDVTTWLAGFDNGSASIADAKRIVQGREDRRELFEALDGARRAEVNERINAKLDVITARVASTRASSLADVPASLQGVLQLAALQAEFDRDFRQFPERSGVAALKAGLVAAQRRVLQGALPEWQKAVSDPKASSEMLQAYAANLARVFPSSDRAEPLRDEYERAVAAAIERKNAAEANAAKQALARAQTGNTDAMVETGWLLLEGRWFTRDLPEAARWYGRAAEGGHPVAMNNLGWMYEQGIGLPRDVNAARRWYEASAAKNHSPAMRNLAQLLALGLGVSDVPETTDWYARQRAADKYLNCVNCAPLHAGRPATILDADRRAAALFRRAADAGDMRAMALLGSLYLIGRANDEGRPDPAQFIRLIKTAADAGDTEGMWQLSAAYNVGRWGVPKDDSESMRWLRSAAERRDIRAMNALAQVYQQGSRVPRDEVEAMGWWRRAADDGDGHAMARVAAGYLDGSGGLPKNQAEGVRWTRAAVQAEDLEAASWLAGWYERGEGGFAKDPAEATAVWTHLARSVNLETAREAVHMLNEQKRDREFREMREQSKRTAWDFLADMVKVAAVMSAVALITTPGGGSLEPIASGRPGDPPSLRFPDAPARKQECGYVSRSFMTVHGSKSILGGPGTQWVCQ